MTKTTERFMKKYKMFFALTVLCILLSYIGLFACVMLTEKKEHLSEFVGKDWIYFSVFVVFEIIVVASMFVCAILSRKMYKKGLAHQAYVLYKDIDDDCSCIFFGIGRQNGRATARATNEGFELCREILNTESEKWTVTERSFFNSWEEMLEAVNNLSPYVRMEARQPMVHSSSDDMWEGENSNEDSES